MKSDVETFGLQLFSNRPNREETVNRNDVPPGTLLSAKGRRELLRSADHQAIVHMGDAERSRLV